jgi:hypothetical protein
MRAKEWLVVGIVILFVSILLVWLLWEKIAEAIIGPLPASSRC